MLAGKVSETLIHKVVFLSDSTNNEAKIPGTEENNILQT
jgi:hypothetical protein